MKMPREKKVREIASVLFLVAAVVSVSGCDDDSPTETGSPPMISQLQVQGVQRISGQAGVAGIGFTYADADADISRFVFSSSTGEGSAGTSLTGVNQESGVTSVQQAVVLPEPGGEVTFEVFVLDRLGNRSNTLEGSFVAP